MASQPDDQDTQESSVPETSVRESPAPSRWIGRYFLTCLAVSLLIVGFSVGNFLLPAVFPRGPRTIWRGLVLGVLIGSVVAQVNLIALWMAVGSGSWIVRVPWAVFLVLVITGACQLGIRTHPRASGNADTLLVLISLSVLLAYIPFRWIPRFRNCALQLSANAAPKSQFNIGSLLIATAILAVSFVLWRQTFPFAIDIDLRRVMRSLLEVASATTPLFIASYLFVAPAAWLAMADRLSASRAILFGLPFAVLFSGIQFAFYCLLFGLRQIEVIESICFLVALNVSQALIVFATIRGLRKLSPVA